jgi:uncharacterized protein YecE (DUF72 family)
VDERPPTSAPTARPPFDRAAWRARREARRLKQREDSVHRAADMRAARCAAGRSAPVEPADDSWAMVGCSGWFYWHWRGTFYPAGSSSGGWFDHYAATFRTVELNAPFYCWPKVSAVQGWVRQARRRKFTYTVKVSDLITHVKRFGRTESLVQDFYHVGNLLGPRMGCFLFQLPPSFRYSKARLERVVRQLDPARRNVVEFRHRSWWNETVYAAFRKAGIIFCSCSGPRLPDELVKTADEVYVRFHGTQRWYRHDYSDEELAVWAERIRASGAKRVWAYFNNDRECYAIRNALELIRQLKGGRSAAAPTVARCAGSGSAKPARKGATRRAATARR